MNKWVSVVYAYKPKNDDELELKVGDEIEVIEFVEDGWLSGKRRTGEVGVFPSNFVQALETTSPSINSNQPPVTAPISKLSLFGNKTSKTSLSSNSLNSNSSNNISNIINSNNNNNSNNINNNIMMNNTQHQESNDLANVDDSSVASSERRPKPIRGVGYGDIFASGRKAKPLPELASNLVNEKLSINMNPLQKQQIPKKPPPPTPTTDNSNGTSSSNDQAPALPPKPSNQFSPLIQHHSKPLPPAQPHPTVQQMREQARVVYAYEPTNDDELAIEVGDIIDIIDKDIEDAGWWRGELRGKIGVFPDNFVQLIEPPNATVAPTNLDRQSRAAANVNLPTVPGSIQQNNDKIKSVFAATPKGFSKELENNLEKHNNPASFLSLKRNKLQHQHSTTGESTMSLDHERREDVVGPLETGTMKLNHITASRAKGPSRRPPSNVLNKRNHLDQIKREFNGKEESTLGSLPVNSSSQPAIHDSLSSLPTGQHTNLNAGVQPAKQTDLTPAIVTSMKPSLSPDSILDSNQALSAPKTSQRVVQPITITEKEKPTTTPAWMVELRKAAAERKRDSPVVVAPSIAPVVVPTSTQDEEQPPITSSTITSTTTISNNTNNTNSTNNINNNLTKSISVAQYDKLLQISKNLTSEISELREDFKRLRDETQGVNELKDMMEAMKIELKACQSASENQKRYIKDLVNNLADERKKIAAMQDEIDRNLK